MKITDSRPVTAAKAVRRYASPADSGSGVAAPRAIDDTATVMGIPAEEMTPKVRSAIMTLMQEVEQARRELEMVQKRVEELEKLADQDTLVGMANRRAFVRELSRMISFVARYNIPTSIIYFDLNDLKAINDTHGHQAGDEAIRHVASLIMENVRDSDVVGRLGGDEFAVILPNAGEQNAHDKAASLSKLIMSMPLNWQGQSIPVSVAYGAYSFRPGEDADKALAEADRKMYANKRIMKSSSAA